MAIGAVLEEAEEGGIELSSRDTGEVVGAEGIDDIVVKMCCEGLLSGW